MRLRPKPILFATIALALGSLAGLYGAEWVFRHLVLAPSVPRNQHEFDRVVASNWRRPIPPEKPAGTIRVLGLSDSFGVAGGDTNYHVLLEQHLRARGYPVEVVNLSVGGYSVEDELRLLQRFGAAYAPDLVLHGFFVGNDFAAAGRTTLTFRGVGVDVDPGPSSWSPGNLSLPRWLERWRYSRAETRRRDADRANGSGGIGFSHEEFLRIERTRISTCRVPSKDGPVWPDTTRLLEAVAAETRRMGARYVLVVHPDEFQVVPALAEEIVREFNLDRSAYDLSLPQKFLRAFAERRSLPIVDLTPSFRTEGGEGGLYVPRDTHYGERGNRLAARVIADALEPLLVDLGGNRRAATN